MTVTGQDRGKIQILQMTTSPQYCRRDNTGAGSFVSMDTYVAKLPIVTAENQNLLADTNDVFYLGCDTTWFGFGICLNTFGNYGTGIYYEYYNERAESAAITGVNTGAKTFTCTGEFAGDMYAGQKVIIAGSTGNNGTYTVVSASLGIGTTDIVVNETVPSGVADGTLYYGGWVEFDPLYDSTESFSAHGVVVWGALEYWGLFTVNTQSAYWIRIKTTSITTVAKWYNLLRNVTIYEPFKLETKTLDGGLHDDIQGYIQKTDITRFSKRGMLSLYDIDVMSCSQEDVHNLKKWQRDRTQLWIVDLARTDPVDFNADAFIRNYIGYCVGVNGAVESPHKEAFPFSIEFRFDEVVECSDAASSETWEDQGEGVYGYTRDSATADSTSDGGDGFLIG